MSDRRGASHFWKGIARGFGGALLFSLPLYMTMEMWWLGFYMSPLRLAALLLFGLPLLVGLASVSGIEKSHGFTEALLGGTTAYGIGLVSSALLLGVLGLIGATDPLSDVAGKIGVQALPAGIGASLARSQLGDTGSQGKAQEQDGPGSSRKPQKHGGSYVAELFLMLAGAIYVAFNVAPTQEMNLLSYIARPVHVLATVVLTLVIMHAFVYAMDFRGAPYGGADTRWWSQLLRFTVPAYVVALGASAVLLWVFGRLESSTLEWVVLRSVVLGLPAGLGAAAARLVV